MPFVEDAMELLLPTPVWLLALALGACIAAFRRPGTGLGRARWALAALAAWAWIFTVPALANALIAHVERDYPPVQPAPGAKPGVIVVLAGGHTRPAAGPRIALDRHSWERARAGVRLWQTIGGTLLFVGSGVPDDPELSVAAAMADVARGLGVPADAVRVETRSRDTHENLLLSRETLARADGAAWLVTSALHMPRAMAVAERLGLRLRAYPCDWSAQHLGWVAWLPNNGAPEMYADALHELIGLAWYRMRGYAS
jgi:uncharacterized SAM-binding protein YcdF (DUF218 family)